MGKDAPRSAAMVRFGLVTAFLAAGFSLVVHTVVEPLHARGRGQAVAGFLDGLNELLQGTGVVAAQKAGLPLGYVPSYPGWLWALGVNLPLYFLAGLLAPYVMGSVIEFAATPLAGFNTGYFVCGLIMLAGGISEPLLRMACGLWPLLARNLRDSGRLGISSSVAMVNARETVMLASLLSQRIERSSRRCDSQGENSSRSPGVSAIRVRISAIVDAGFGVIADGVSA